jgi:FdhD protein
MSSPRSVTVVRAIKVRPGNRAEMPEHVATEEPMEIRVGGPGQDPRPLAVTMRTPGHDFELAVGFAITEGVTDRNGVVSVSYCHAPRDADSRDAEDDRYNTVSLKLNHTWEPWEPARLFAASASCGVCGKSSIASVEVGCPPVPAAPPIPASMVPLLPDRLRSAQRVFDRTGGLHAAGLFGPDGVLRCAREDVGRHNAVDKVIGHTVIGHTVIGHTVIGHTVAGAVLAGSVLMVSGRVSFEIVQKAAVAGIGTIAAVSAPSSLAVEAAERLGVALIAFVRGGSFNVYSHPERLLLDD